MSKSTDDLDTYRGIAPASIPAPRGAHRGEPLIQTPGRYGWNATPANIAAQQANIAAMREQSARRRARKNGDAR